MMKCRFAPSPTGKLHIGNARTALITWLATRNAGGEFLLRIDDTDKERSKDEYTDAIQRDLTWLGLDWDNLAHQRDRMDLYDAKIESLKQSGRIYPCYETPEQLELKRKTLLNKGQPPIYDRGALALSADDRAQLEAEGLKPHWRFKLDLAPIQWHDAVRGDVAFHGKDLSDPVVLREDGSPLYHLCSVIDDIDFGITHVVRGEDHVSNTATHIQMFEALGGPVPIFAHLPLLSDAQGGKLSKRIGSLSIESIRVDEGLEAMAVNSLLSRLGTSDPIDAFDDLTPLVKSFDFSKFSRGTPKADPDELLRLNAKILHSLPFDVVRERLSAEHKEQINRDYWRAVRPNLERVADVSTWLNITHGAIDTPIADEDRDYIALAATCLPEGPFDDDSWSQWIAVIKGKSDRKGKGLFMPLRQTLTGMNHGPEMDKMLTLIGRERTLERLKSATA